MTKIYSRFVFNDYEQNRKGETNTLPSETVPDQALSIKTLIERHTRGQYVPQNRVEYDDDDDFPAGVERMDKLEYLEFMRENAQRISEMSNALEEQLNLERDEKVKKQYEAYVQEQFSKKAPKEPDDKDGEK